MQTPGEISVKPRILIADDSRIVRATLIKHIEGMFEFREALDGEQAWEVLLLDPSIRVVITDLTMPKLDGYGLLQRIRGSKVSRIRDIPVIVISGSDERQECERAKAAGATDLITKGIGTAQLLSRLDILSKLVSTQREFERGLEALVHSDTPDAAVMKLASPEELRTQAEVLLANAAKHKKNFVILNVSIGLKHVGHEGGIQQPPDAIIDAIGQLLRRTIRQTDHVAKTGEASYTLATGSINFDSARFFALRVCKAIANANLLKDDNVALVASCGLASLSDSGSDPSAITFDAMNEAANRRAVLGMERAVTGVVGAEEEASFLLGDTKAGALDDGAMQQGGGVGGDISEPDAAPGGVPDLATVLQWLKEGKEEQVRPYIGKLANELQPLINMMMTKK
ncbi:response regulator [Noviherbaspirillum massiliense]|uniref:response regulator n=1 Tax=Noviherbaspirillum massiliense TaxID=1465823 RepID=UPI0002F649BB|nr:response regulator [Noviherbaspirillum massiliense]